jgi:hypothetical protein
MLCTPRMICVLVFSLFASSALLADERFLSETEEAVQRALLPKIADAKIQKRIDDQERTFFFNSRRFWQGAYSGSYNYTQYTYNSRGRRRNARTFPVNYSGVTLNSLQPTGGLDVELQWKFPAGEKPSPGEGEIKFISLPKDKKGNLVALAYLEDLSVVYPNGTMFGGCRYETVNGKKVPFEVRIREKVAGKWKPRVFKSSKKHSGSFAFAKSADTASCMECHKDAGTVVTSSFGWSGKIGNDSVFSFGEYAGPVNGSDATVSAKMVEMGLLVEYDAKKHAKTHGVIQDAKK